MNDYKNLLIQKVQSEYGEFIESLKKLPSEKVIDFSYEKVIKEDLVTSIDSTSLDEIQAKSLYRLKYPLDYCYQEWLDNDLSHMEMLEDTINDAANKISNRERNDKESR